MCGTEELILSDSEYDTAVPLTVDELIALTSPGDSEVPGFIFQHSVVPEGVGSFRLGLPRSYSVIWQADTPTEILEHLGRTRNPDWTDHWLEFIADDGGSLRAMSIDTAVEDEAVAVQIMLSGLAAGTEGTIADEVAAYYTDAGSTVGEACTVTLNGAEGAFVEFSVPSELVGGTGDRAALQFYIPDSETDTLWSVTCDVPRSHLAGAKAACMDIAASFQPLPITRD